MSDNILKKGNVITLINNNERIPGIIKSVLVDRGKENKGDSELNWMDKHFERNLFVNTPTYQEVNNRRYKALKKGDLPVERFYYHELFHKVLCLLQLHTYHQSLRIYLLL